MIDDFRAAIGMVLRLFPLLVLGRLIGKWFTADSAGAWLSWLSADWTVELLIGFIASFLVSVAAIFGLDNNRYIDRRG